MSDHSTNSHLSSSMSSDTTPQLQNGDSSPPGDNNKTTIPYPLLLQKLTHLESLNSQIQANYMYHHRNKEGYISSTSTTTAESENKLQTSHGSSSNTATTKSLHYSLNQNANREALKTSLLDAKSHSQNNNKKPPRIIWVQGSIGKSSIILQMDKLLREELGKKVACCLGNCVKRPPPFHHDHHYHHQEKKVASGNRKSAAAAPNDTVISPRPNESFFDFLSTLEKKHLRHLHSTASLQNWYFTMRELLRINGEIPSKDAFCDMMGNLRGMNSSHNQQETASALNVSTMFEAVMQHFLSTDEAFDYILLEEGLESYIGVGCRRIIEERTKDGSPQALKAARLHLPLPHAVVLTYWKDDLSGIQSLDNLLSCIRVLNSFKNDASKGEDIAFFTSGTQSDGVLRRLDEEKSHQNNFTYSVIPVVEEHGVMNSSEHCHLVARGVLSVLLEKKSLKKHRSDDSTALSLLPCHMEEFQWNKSILLLDQAEGLHSVRRLIEYTLHHYHAHCRSFVFVLGFEYDPWLEARNHGTTTGTCSPTQKAHITSILDLLELQANNHLNKQSCSFSVIFLRSIQSTSLNTEWMEDYVNSSCRTLQLASLGLKNRTDRGVSLLEKYSQQQMDSENDNQVILTFGSAHLSAELRRRLTKKKQLKKIGDTDANASNDHQHLLWASQPDRYFEYERDRLLVRYFKQNALLQGISVVVKSFGWILQFSKRHKYWMVGHNLGINNSNSAALCRDKAATCTVLQMHKIPHVPHYIFVHPNQDTFHGSGGVWKSITQQFEKLGRNVVVKPKEGSEGIGVSHCTTQRQLEAEVHAQLARARDFCMCPFFEIASEIRCIILDQVPMLVYRKKVPYLEGDGTSTKLELFLAYEQQHKSLVSNNMRGGSQIPEVVTQDPYGVLARGERLALSWKFNLSGGHMLLEEIDIHSEEGRRYVEMALRSTQALQLRFGSVDLIENSSGDDLRVLEVNSNVWMSKYSLRRSAAGGDEVARRVYSCALYAMFEHASNW